MSNKRKNKDAIVTVRLTEDQLQKLDACIAEIDARRSSQYGDTKTTPRSAILRSGLELMLAQFEA